MARGAPAARAGGRPTGVMVGSGWRGEGASRPLSPPPRNRLLWRPGEAASSPGRDRVASSCQPFVGSPPSRRRTLDAEVTLRAGRGGSPGEATRATAKSGVRDELPGLPRQGLPSDFSRSPGACQLVGDLRESLCWTLVFRGTSFVGFWALAAESSENTKTSLESPGAFALTPQPPLTGELGLLGVLEMGCGLTFVAPSISPLKKLGSVLSWRFFFPPPRPLPFSELELRVVGGTE